jgi:CheY-like chemotaxis protein
MNKNGPLIVIEDDQDDQELLQNVFNELGYPNEIVFFEDGEAALTYIQGDRIFPFLILSDINLPKLSGFELRKMVQTNEGLSSKCIPYLFFSTSVEKKAVYDAYTMSVQGFFMKPSNYEHLKRTIKIMIEYWRECYSPNHFED